MSKKLLLADDSLTVQRVVELTFADEGIEVVSVPDGDQAVARIEHERPDIVLADVSMPGRDGYQVAEFVKTTSHLSHIPVVLMTGAFEQLDEERARGVKCDAALAKPFEPQRVVNLVNQLLSGEVGPGFGLSPAAVDPPAPSTPSDASSVQSLDDYLERLDDALTAATGPISVRSAVDRMPESIAASAAAPTSAAPPEASGSPGIDTRPDSVSEPAPSEPKPSDTPSLADAFSALLA
ncbi:MAG: response regulator, partial [Vicinamibacterales bacterium]